MMYVKLWSEGYKCTQKRHFLSYRKHRHDPQITWPYAYYVTLGSRCKMANSSSKDETDTLPERPTRIQLYQSGRILKEYRNIVSASKQNPMRYSMGFAKSHSLKCSLHKWAWCSAARKSARLNCINLIHFRLTAGRLRGSSCIVIAGVVCELLQFMATQCPVLLTTHIRSLLKNLRWQPHWLRRLTSLPGKPTENKID